MIWTRIDESTRTLLYSVTCLSIVVLALWFGATLNSAAANTGKAKNAVPVATFPANSGTLGAIPDNLPGSPRDVTFTVSGLSGAPSNVEANMTFGGPGLAVGHSWVGDLNVWLIAPNGTSFVVFGRTGQTGASAGDSSDLTGPYTFKDSAMGTNWWAEAFARTSTQVLTSGDYRTTASGPQPVNNTSPATDFSAAFSGVANPNGTWTLRFTDNAGGDTGAVSAANLTIETAAAPSGPTDNDRDGDGTTDFTIVRDVTPPLSGPSPMLQAKSVRERVRIQAEMAGKGRDGADDLGNVPGSNALWATSFSGGGSDLSLFGDAATDWLVPADFDGDNKADVAIWRGVASSGPGGGFFFVFRSSDNTTDTVDFGIAGDDPTVSGDYDGDGTADPAVFRCPAGGGQCHFYYKGSAGGGEITFEPWGNGTANLTVFPSPGDYDGDGKYDFNVQITNPNVSGGGLFVLRRSSDNGVEYIPWGLNSDLIVPGDYDGDGKYDIAVARSQSGQRFWYILERDGGSQAASWGLSTDWVVPGDYDGDGKTDVAVFRPSVDPDNNVWYVYQSGTGTVLGYEWGIETDYPLTNWRVH